MACASQNSARIRIIVDPENLMHEIVLFISEKSKVPLGFAQGAWHYGIADSGGIRLLLIIDQTG